MQLFYTAGIKAKALLANPDGSANIYLNSGGYLIIDLSGDFSEFMNTIFTLKSQTDLFSTTTPITYIDIRFGNKVYYKTRANGV